MCVRFVPLYVYTVYIVYYYCFHASEQDNCYCNMIYIYILNTFGCPCSARGTENFPGADAHTSTICVWSKFGALVVLVFVLSRTCYSIVCRQQTLQTWLSSAQPNRPRQRFKRTSILQEDPIDSHWHRIQELPQRLETGPGVSSC